MTRERAHVMYVDSDFLSGLFSVACFCGWESETCWEEREEAEAAYQRHKTTEPAVLEHDGLRPEQELRKQEEG